MNYQERFEQIRDFLNQHTYLHEMEALVRYPLGKHDYTHWMDEIQAMSEEHKYLLENTLNPELVKSSDYKKFLLDIQKLITIPFTNLTPEKIDPILGRKMKEKKCHEIGIIKKQITPHNFKNYIDIGSGAGHLSSLLLFENTKSSLCIDMSEHNQDIGIKKLGADFPEILKRLTFKTLTFDHATKLPANNNTALIGLHCCGDLSVNLINSFIQNNYSGLLNYGCCYNKLTDQSINLSQLAKKAPVALTNHALTMATKSYKSISKKEYEYRKRVKNFRYALHIFLKDYYDRDFANLGSAKTQDYQGDFGEYCLKYVLDMPKDVTKEQLNTFYHNEKTKKKVQQLLDFGIIRSHTARVIELYLMLDRSIYLEENGYEVTMEESFDKDISPRNVSIFAKAPIPA